MKKSLRIPLAMSAKAIPLAVTVLTAAVGLTGCTDKHITEVKALPFTYDSEYIQNPNMTVGQVLDHRKICDSVKWTVDNTDRGQTFVQYECDYKGVKDSAFVAAEVAKRPNSKPADRIGDIYQWVYGASGRPSLTYVAMQMHFPSGNTKTVNANGMLVAPLQMAAVENTIGDYDHLKSVLSQTPIPAKPTPAEAKLDAVASAMSSTQETQDQGQSPQQAQGQASSAPTVASIPGTSSQQNGPTDSAAAPMASTAMAPATTAPVVAPTAAVNASRSGAVGPDGWPVMTPCIQKLQDKFTADQQKQNADTSTSLEQMQEWADVCKSLGQ